MPWWYGHKSAVPERRLNKGPAPKKTKPQTKSIRIHKRLEQQPEEALQRTFVKNTTKGKLLVDVLHELFGFEMERNQGQIAGTWLFGEKTSFASFFFITKSLYNGWSFSEDGNSPQKTSIRN